MDHHNGFHKLTKLLLVMSIGQQLCQEINVSFEPQNIKLYNVSSQQRLIVEWNVSAAAYESNSDIMFHIQVGRAKEMNIIHNHNYSAHLSKTNKPFRWVWDSELPLECESHSVRIRNVLPRNNDERWSAWNTHYGENRADRSEPFIYPHEKIVHEGSNVSFCCIPNKEKQVIKMQYGRRNGCNYSAPENSTGTFVITVRNVPRSTSDGTNVICFFDRSEKDWHGTVLIVSRPPDEPSNISCETSDLKILTCTWSPGLKYNFQTDGNGDGKLAPKYTMHEGFTDFTTDCPARNRCTLPIEKSQTIYNFTLTAENQLGRRNVNIVVNVMESVRPLAPETLLIDQVKSRSAKLSWSLEPSYQGLELLCQIGLQKINREEELINITIEGTHTAPFIVHIGQEKLQPYSSYTVRVRCVVTSSMYKWSQWSRNITLRTPEDVPTVPLDIWREVNETNRGKVVTLHWRPLLDLSANGNISRYNVTWQSLGEHSESKHRIVSAPRTTTQITMGSQAYAIIITAINGAGSSPAAEIRIPDFSTNGTHDVREEKTLGGNGTISLSWASHHNIGNGYVVEWCNYPRTPHCDLQWKRLNSSIHHDVIRSDAFRPGVRYHFRIYESTPNGELLLGRRAGYIKELPVSDGPIVKIESEPDTLHLNWAAFTVNDSQEGFIIGYKVYIKHPEDICEDDKRTCYSDVKDPTIKTFTINQLKPATDYEVAVTAVTKGGESSPNFEKIRTPFNTGAAVLAIVLSVVTFSAIALMLLTIGYWKRKWLKKQFYPDIPNPNKSKILSFDDVKSNGVRKMMSPSRTKFQNITIVKVQEPKIPQNLNSEKYQEKYPQCHHRYENEMVWCGCSKERTSGCLVHGDQSSTSREDLQETLYPSDPYNYLQFFNRNYCGTPEDVFKTVIHLGYKPQTETPIPGLPLIACHNSSNDAETTNFNTMYDLARSGASREDLHSLEIGEMSPVSINSSSFMIKD